MKQKNHHFCNRIALKSKLSMENEINMKKILPFCLVIITLLSVSTVLAEQNGSNTELPYPANIPSELTPFNFTTIVRWTPYMIDDSLGSANLIGKGQFGPKTGKELNIYGTLLPMTPNETRLSYSFKILNLEGPSNVSLIFKVELNSVTQKGAMRMTDYPENNTVLNSAVNNSVSGSVSLDVSGGLIGSANSPYQINPYSYANIMQNIKANWAYSLLTLQPVSDNNSIAWNHNLTVQVNLSGYEDKVFFNYMRTEKGYSPWKDSDFTPLNIPESIFADNKMEQIYLQPESQPSIKELSPIQLVYLSNETNYGSKVLQVKLETKATSNYKIHFTVLRGLYLDGAGFWSKQYTFITPILSNANNLVVQVPWQKFNGLNMTVTSANKAERFVNTTEGSFQTNTGNGNYIILNKVELSFESVNGPWDMWLTGQVQVKWLNGINLPDDTMNVTINQKSNLMDFTGLVNQNSAFDMANIGKKSNLPFAPDFLVIGVLALFAVLKKLKWNK